MINVKENVMFKEAEEAKYRLNPVLQVLIFIGMFIVLQLVIGVFVAVPQTIWMFTNESFMNSIAIGDVESAMNAINGMPSWLLLVQLFLTIIEIALPIIYCKYIEKRSLRSMGFMKKGFLIKYLQGYAVGAVMILAAGLLAAVTGTISIKLSSSISVIYILLFFAGYLIQGMGEEVFVRGYFMISFKNSMKNKYAAAIAVVVSSLLFAMLHLLNPGFTVLAFVNIMIAGVFFAVYILRTDNIIGACAAHSAWNFVQGNIIGVQVSGLDMNASIFTSVCKGESTLINGGSFGLEGGLAVTIVQVIAIILVLFIPKKNVVK